MIELKIGDTIVVYGQELVITTIDQRTDWKGHSATLHLVDPILAADFQEQERLKRGALETAKEQRELIPGLKRQLDEHDHEHGDG